MPSCLIVQHIEPESGFAITDALLSAGVELDVRRMYAGESVPSDTSGLGGLVVMGGPMSAASDEGFATRTAEVALIGEAVRLGVPTLGVCLGAQLLAVAMGAPVFAGSAGPEIGWGAVELLDSCAEDLLFAELPKKLNVLHWHGDTFDLPVGAVRLMANENYANQGFRIGTHAWGLQFHLEVTPSAVDGFLAAFSEEAELAEGGAHGIRSMTSAAITAIQPPRNLVLERFATLVATHVGKGHAPQR